MSLTFTQNAKSDLCIYDSDFKIKIKQKVDHAVLYFTNKNDEKIAIPFNINVNNTEYSHVRQYPTNNEYVLCWLDPYIVVLDNKQIVKISSERSFVITPYTDA